MNTDEYKYKYDLHVHTSPVSKCGDFSPMEVVDRYADAGFRGIVITNHFSLTAMAPCKSKEEYLDFYLTDYREALAYGKKKGLDVFLGAEMRFPENDNDYLVYGIDEKDLYTAYDYLFTEYEKFYCEFKNENNIIIQAHPFRSSCVLKSPDIIDGIEVFNMHPGHNSRVAVAAKLHAAHGGVVTGGTDLHHRDHEGSLFTCFAEMPQNEKDLVRLLRSGDYVFMTADKIIIP